MTTPEGPATLPWNEKVERMVNVLGAELPAAFTDGTESIDLERVAERLLVAIGDANV